MQPPALLVVGEVVALRERLSPALRRPLAGWRVLVTRTRRQASSLAEALRAEGAEPVLLPAIEIARRADPEAVRAAIEALRAGACDWVAFTSGNAVEAWFDLVREAGEDARLFAATNIAAVGAATARALEARGLSADLLPERASGTGVADALLERGVEGARVLVPRAERADPALGAPRALCAPRAPRSTRSRSTSRPRRPTRRPRCWPPAHVRTPARSRR